MSVAPPRTSRDSRSSASRESAPAATKAEEDELERFRQEWKREVQDRKGQPGPVSVPASVPVPRDDTHCAQDHHNGDKTAGPPIKSQETSPVRTMAEVRSPRKPTRISEDEGVAAPPAPAAQAQRQSKPTKGEHKVQTGKAVDLYGQAVDHELSGQLREALHLYRKAFRLDGNVERAYAKKVVQDENELYEATPELEVTNPALPISVHAPFAAPYVFKKELQYHPDYTPAYHRLAPRQQTLVDSDSARKPADEPVPAPSDPLSRIIDAFGPTAQLRFEPEEAKWPVRLESLPEEVFQDVLRFLDAQAIERVALVARKARVWTRSARKWRRLCETIYRPPQVPNDLTPLMLAHRHGLDWRTTLIEEPRVRYDGVYIAVCHYVRQGASDEAWVTISHLITYHRFLRFYPDGTVISYLTTEQPADVVHSLRPSLRGTGLNFGTWALRRPSATHPHPRIEIRQLLEPGVTPKYEFEMDITLKTTHRGRWNKLDLNVYRSINLATEESLDMPLKHQKPFYFSKVRSYHPVF